MPDPPLAVLQQWVQTVLTASGDLPEKLLLARQRHGLTVDDVVRGTHRGTASTRLGIHARGYVMRLVETLRADFPVLRAFLGEQVFDAFARAYVVTYPPTSPSLYDLGARLAQFLEETRPQSDEALEAMLELPAEIARLERARAESGRAPGVEEQESVRGAFDVFSGTIAAAPCLRLLESRFPLAEFVRAIERGETPDPPPPRRSLLAVGRAHYRVNIDELAPWQYAFLRACAEPVSVFTAARDAAAATNREPSQLLADVALWLPVAASRGYVRSD